MTVYAAFMEEEAPIPSSSSSEPPSEAASDEAVEKLGRLRGLLSGFERVVVAFSGGVDSTFLLRVAHDVLAGAVTALTSRSASLMQLEFDEAVSLAKELGVRHEVVETREIDRAGYVENSPERCYFCKAELFDTAALVAARHEGAIVVDGFNADDQFDFRPGRRAADERRVRHPLAEVDLTKSEIRALSRHLGLRTWNKPQLACLASRLPYGVRVTQDRLARVERVETELRRRGFVDVRARLVKDNDDFVRIEVKEADLRRVVDDDHRRAIIASVRQSGFRFVTLDLEGFRTGRMNESLVEREALVQVGSRSRSSG